MAGRADLSGRREVGPDGRIDLGRAGRPRVEGRAVGEVEHAVAAALGMPAEGVHVAVAAYHSQHVYLYGKGVGVQRSVPYQGPETVFDLLRRVGGVTPGAAPSDVYVVRPHLAEGRQAEVFHVDLKAVVLRHDPRTNLRLRPFDQLYVGETKPASMQAWVPPCLRPLYQAAWGLQGRMKDER